MNIRHKEEYNQKAPRNLGLQLLASDLKPEKASRGQGNLQFAHTLNGTACAVPRMIISILETFQNEARESLILLALAVSACLGSRL